MRRTESRRGVGFAGALLAMTLASSLLTRPSGAQSRLELGGAMLANGEEQRYLRALALTDSARSLAVSLQPFGASGDAAARGLATTIGHPWASRFAATTDGPQPITPVARRSMADRPRGALLRPDARAVFLSDRPWAADDGVVWAGRGATLAAQAGVSASWWRLRAQLAPVAFYAQNAAFALAPNGRTGDERYRDARFPRSIDLPQRFGDTPYGRLDLGDSFIEAEAGGLVLGVSNARQHWGPAREYPLVLGTGSGGFAHAHLSAAEPVDLRVGHLQFRLMGAQLAESSFAPANSAGTSTRFLSAFVFAFRPRLIDAVEVGASRLVNGPWPAGGFGLGELALPFEGIVNNNRDPINQNTYNGFASVFLRIAPRGSGLEVYAELSREDFAGDARQLLLEPDDLVHYTVGVARARRDADGLSVLRAELVNGEVSHFERQGRGLDRPIAPYTHSPTTQGLTNRGQLLGSAAAFAGAGGTLAWDRYSERGRRTYSIERLVLRDWLPALGSTGGVPEAEVSYRLAAEELRFRGNRDWSLQVATRYTLNANLEQGRDVFGLELQFRWRGW